MRTTMGWALFGLFLTAACGEDVEGVVAPPEAYALVWADEFDGEAGTAPNRDVWVYDVGTGPNNDGWGNQELQFYSDSTANVSLDGNGNLVITALRQDFAGREYTSGRIKTQGNFAQEYGRIEARIQLPVGQGMWPAFWMLGTNSAGELDWPETGEIDIMEYRGQDPFSIIGSLHGPGYSAGGAISRTLRSDAEQGFDQNFHVYAIEWDATRISWSVDDEVFGVVSVSDVLNQGDWVYDDPYFILFNLAVGGTFVGDVGADTTFPQTMLVDYVRVFDRVR